MNIYIEEIRKVLRQEEINFRLVGKLLELAVGELYRELLLLLGEEIERERQKRERGKAQSQEEELISEEALPCPHFVRVGRPPGRKDTAPRTTLREFFEKEILPLHKETRMCLTTLSLLPYGLLQVFFRNPQVLEALHVL